ncbi:MAG: hypothetical protein H0X25_13955 [Acidobacteriales bacterium]|nr:hypothetical protein [Terriglobales bacterium]
MFRRPFCHFSRQLLLSAFIFLLSASSWAASTKVIYSFAGDEDGEYPDTDLVLDKAGNIYGTTVLGGDFGSGTVFMLSRSGNGWSHTVLYDFTSGKDGGQPYKGVTLDAQGNLYGTTVTGGTGSCEGGCGVAYKLTNSSGVWTQTVLHSFTGGNDGSGPGNALTIDPAGNLFGMTPIGGAFGLGTIYQLHPRSDGSYAFRVIHQFAGGIEGSSASAGRLLLDQTGNLYGVTTVGGIHESGMAFELVRSPQGFQYKDLYNFHGVPESGFPYSALVRDSTGHLYGTTYYAGANNLGSVYELTYHAGIWQQDLLYSFTAGIDANSPIGNLVVGSTGKLYGASSEGGTATVGTIFQLSRDGNGQWTESVVYNFQGSPDAALPYDGMVGDGQGNYYGATVRGGVADEGAIYQFTP